MSQSREPDRSFGQTLAGCLAALGASATPGALAGAEAKWQALDEVARRDLAAALALVRVTLDPASVAGFSIRTFRTGDIGLLASRQSILYAQSHGWMRKLEILEGEVTIQFLRAFREGREQCWIAEVDGAMAGSVLVTDEGEGVARLRMLYVEPFARGRGIGDALVGSCVDFARHVGYARLTLWTHTVLADARRIYARHGFRMTENAVHFAFGTPVKGETWLLELKRKGGLLF